jgi:hypothetical protein
MRLWGVEVLYGCGYTKGREWQEQARVALETRGWTHVWFWNHRSPNFCQSSGRADDDEIRFVVPSEADERAVRQAVEKVLEQVGIVPTLVRIEERQPE